MTRQNRQKSSTIAVNNVKGTKHVLIAGATILASLMLVLTMAVRPMAFAENANTSVGKEPMTSALAPGQIDGSGSATVLVYLNGSDLESEAGEATSDIAEMLESGIGKNANVVIETLGTKEWQDYGIASDHTQRYIVNQGKLELVDDSLGQLDTTDPDTLADFISWGVQNYPADRYMLVFWDHGAGPVYGFGYDEFQSEESALTIDEMKQALEANPNVHFDMIGMDCCIMGSLETCLALQSFCDYTIVSEDFEPGIGWSYKGWMSQLEQNPSTDMVTLGKVIVDDMIGDVAADEENGEATLALIDESKVGKLYTAWVDFAYASEEQLLGTNYSQETEWRDRPGQGQDESSRTHDSQCNGMSQIISMITGEDCEDCNSCTNCASDCSTCEGYGDYYDEWDRYWDEWDYDGSYVTMTDYFVTDIMEVASAIESDEATALKSAFETAMVHYNSTSGEVNMSGLGVTLPYGDGEFYDQMVEVFTATGIDSAYVDWLEAFVSAEGANNYYDYGSDSEGAYGYDDMYGYDGMSGFGGMHGDESHGYGPSAGHGHSSQGYYSNDGYDYDEYGYGYESDDYGYGSDSTSGNGAHGSNVGKLEWSSSPSAESGNHHQVF